MTPLDLVFAVAAILWLATSLLWLIASLAMRRLPALEPLTSSEPLVSVVLAVRDEGARLETTIRRLFAQRHVRIQVVAVDDRSRDDTPLLLERLRGEFAALHPVRVETLPQGWLGKCHALHQGSASATGDWLLFSDGDIWLTPDVVRRAVAAAEREGVEHVALTPHVRPTNGQPASFLYEACLIPLQTVLSLPLFLANRDHPKGFGGIGAFNLLRTAVYRGFGGHAAIRMDVADDMKLGVLVRRAGGRSRFFVGNDDVRCDYANDLRGLVKALEKNNFAAVGYDTRKIVIATALWGGLWLLAMLGPLAGTTAGVAAFLALSSLAVTGVVQARLTQMRPAAGLLMPFTILFGAVTMWNSVIVTLRQGGIRWRDTFYPLAALRAGSLPPP